MLGYDVSWAAFNIVEVMSSSKFTYKVRIFSSLCMLALNLQEYNGNTKGCSLNMGSDQTNQPIEMSHSEFCEVNCVGTIT